VVILSTLINPKPHHHFSALNILDTLLLQLIAIFAPPLYRCAASAHQSESTTTLSSTLMSPVTSFNPGQDLLVLPASPALLTLSHA
jgi:hypothetical protein